MQSTSEILKQIDLGKLDVQKALALLEKEQTNKSCVKGSKKIKIRIRVDEEKNKTNINIPGLPIWLVEKMLILSLRITGPFLKEERIKNIDILDIKTLFECIRNIPPTKIVEIDVKEDNTKVEIFTY